VTVLETARVLAECTRELTCLTDGEGLVVAAAGPWEQAAGVAAGEVSGRLVDALVHEDDRAEFRACREAVAAGIVAGPLDVRLAASVWRIYDVELRRADGHVAVSLRDVTEQRRVEDRLN
jgi:PAS domain-containing protein